jgi:hypothetical protein
MNIRGFKIGIGIARIVKFSWKFKRLTIFTNPPVYHWLWFIFFCYREYPYILAVQLDENQKPCIAGCSIKWLEHIDVYYMFNQNKQINKALKHYEKYYPEYKGFLELH